MNSYDIFRKLTKGVKFDSKRFKNDFQRLGLRKTESTLKLPEEEVTAQRISELASDEPDPEADCAKSDRDQLIPDSNNAITMLGDIKTKHQSNLSKTQKKKAGKKTKEKRLALKQEKINHFRNKNNIHVWGSDVPQPVETFEQLETQYEVNPVLVKNLKGLGYAVPMPIQMQVWPLMFGGREVLACAPTGSGKTAGFLVPILQQLGAPQRRGFRAVIVSPTRELAKQIHRECVRLSEGLGLRVHIINNVNKAKDKFGSKSSQKFDILVTTPNRIVYLLQEDNPAISLANVEWLIVDESDRLMEGGIKGFRDQLGVIMQACCGPNLRRALFSATFAFDVENWCKLNLDNVAMVTVGARNTASTDVQQELIFCGDESGKMMALRDLFRKGFEPPVLIFVQTKDRAKELFRELIYDNIMVDVIHADRTQLQRDKVVAAFRERKIWVLICTELMARGMDFKGVNLVINYDFPPSITSYIHRVGRTGRANRAGKAVSFWVMTDRPQLRSVAHVIRDSGSSVPEWMLEMDKTSKNEKKKAATKQPFRGHVSAAVHMESSLKKRKRVMIKASKKKASATRNGNMESKSDDHNTQQITGSGIEEKRRKKMDQKHQINEEPPRKKLRP